MKRTTCLWCGHDLNGGDSCSMCGPQPNLTCPECGEDYFGTGKGICPICGYQWDEEGTALAVAPV
ncbi:hypothetical protein GMST_25160 [Geomonas silvestris]|uniref:Uncharacterized protein n=1 Tax=Geomonas silvestris TaxID=2740184 RepID=A0A6V8MJM3_9BACT|nr:hypothetical protein [Geomonas silvestris]GFO60191.1 hypothetical protein GMST_25160 [Geomonas silvestris]